MLPRWPSLGSGYTGAAAAPGPPASGGAGSSRDLSPGDEAVEALPETPLKGGLDAVVEPDWVDHALAPLDRETLLAASGLQTSKQLYGAVIRFKRRHPDGTPTTNPTTLPTKPTTLRRHLDDAQTLPDLPKKGLLAPSAAISGQHDPGSMYACG